MPSTKDQRQSRTLKTEKKQIKVCRQKKKKGTMALQQNNAHG